MIQYLYLGRMGYGEALQLQAELEEARHQGQVDNVLLLLEHPPVLTLGRNAHRSNVLASDEFQASRGITLHDINRGGDVTYHGPGQLVGYPIFDLRSLHNSNGSRLGPVDFVRMMEEALIRVCGVYGIAAGRISGLTGVWCGFDPQPQDSSRALRSAGPVPGGESKIAAIGVHVSRGITSHGFAFNIATDLRDFKLIIPCGITDHSVTSLKNEIQAQKSARQRQVPTLEAAADEVAGQFGQDFGQQVLAVQSLAALRSQAATPSPSAFPAEDSPVEGTPLRVPPEIERLQHKRDRTITDRPSLA